MLFAKSVAVVVYARPGCFASRKCKRGAGGRKGVALRSEAGRANGRRSVVMYPEWKEMRAVWSWMDLFLLHLHMAFRLTCF